MGDKVSGAEDSVIPMKKTSTTTYVALGVGVLAIGGIVAVSGLGRADAEAEKKAAEIKALAARKDTSQLSLKEQREHMKMTALAFQKAEEAAAEKKAAAARQEAEAAEKEQARAAAAAAPAHAAGDAPEPVAAAPPPKPAVNKKASKKQMDGLDSIGSDIASALK